MNGNMRKWVGVLVGFAFIVVAASGGAFFLGYSLQMDRDQQRFENIEAQLTQLNRDIDDLSSQSSRLAQLDQEIARLESLEPGSDTGTQNSIASVVSAVTPSVVAINTRYTARSFFGRTLTQTGAGSGWIMDTEGTIITNYHVIEDADAVTVALYDGRTIDVNPSTILSSPENDLAVIKIDATGLVPVEPADSSGLRVGDWVVAVGNALGRGITAKEGIISRLDVALTIEDQTLTDLIETSAAINPGNSGGPLVDMNGQVIGITSAKVSSVGVEGLGYAISIDDAWSVIEGLIG